MILYISHRLEEVFHIADHISVMRDGKYIGTCACAEVDIPFIVSRMVGQELNEQFPAISDVPGDSPIALNLTDLFWRNHVGPISFSVRAGEIVGFAGLESSGIRDLFQRLFGLVKPDSGQKLDIQEFRL